MAVVHEVDPGALQQRLQVAQQDVVLLRVLVPHPDDDAVLVALLDALGVGEVGHHVVAEALRPLVEDHHLVLGVLELPGRDLLSQPLVLVGADGQVLEDELAVPLGQGIAEVAPGLLVAAGPRTQRRVGIGAGVAPDARGEQRHQADVADRRRVVPLAPRCGGRQREDLLVGGRGEGVVLDPRRLDGGVAGGVDLLGHALVRGLGDLLGHRVVVRGVQGAVAVTPALHLVVADGREDRRVLDDLGPRVHLPVPRDSSSVALQDREERRATLVVEPLRGPVGDVDQVAGEKNTASMRPSSSVMVRAASSMFAGVLTIA